MDINKQYDQWSATYDSQENKTRDLELKSQFELLDQYSFENALEIGCGTGKNTSFLLKRSANLISIDFSEKMIQKAKERYSTFKNNFLIMDITKPWTFNTSEFDLVSESLVLEHISDLDFIFQQAIKVLMPGGIFYISELHPFKQYSGSKARINTPEGYKEITCYVHNFSDFTNAANKAGFMLHTIKEYFDNDDKSQIPRIISMIFKK